MKEKNAHTKNTQPIRFRFKCLSLLKLNSFHCFTFVWFLFDYLYSHKKQIRKLDIVPIRTEPIQFNSIGSNRAMNIRLSLIFIAANKNVTIDLWWLMIKTTLAHKLTFSFVAFIFESNLSCFASETVYFHIVVVVFATNFFCCHFHFAVTFFLRSLKRKKNSFLPNVRVLLPSQQVWISDCPKHIQTYYCLDSTTNTPKSSWNCIVMGVFFCLPVFLKFWDCIQLIYCMILISID